MPFAVIRKYPPEFFSRSHLIDAKIFAEKIIACITVSIPVTAHQQTDILFAFYRDRIGDDKGIFELAPERFGKTFIHAILTGDQKDRFGSGFFKRYNSDFAFKSSAQPGGESFRRFPQSTFTRLSFCGKCRYLKLRYRRKGGKKHKKC